MAAPDTAKAIACDKCFATIPLGATICPECGAPVKNVTTAEAEVAIYPELAAANLSRMRGDYKLAEEQLLTIVRKYPNNPSANEMLGDLATEREDYDQAIQWFELALEILPDSASIARKVRGARERIEKKDAQETTANLGIPSQSSKLPLLIGVFTILGIAIAIVAYMMGTSVKAKSSQPINVIRAENGSVEQPKTTGSEPKGSGEAAPATRSGDLAAEDLNLTGTFREKATDGTSILSVAQDPRSNSLTITFTMTGDHDRTLAARIARDAFLSFPSYNFVTLRGVSEGKVAYMADAYRTKVEETQTPAWKQQHQDDPDAWIGHVLSTEWGAAAGTGSTTPPDAGPGTAATTTSTGGETTGTTGQ